MERKAGDISGSPEKNFISRKDAEAQREMSRFRQENLAETLPFLLFFRTSLLTQAFFQGSHIWPAGMKMNEAHHS